MKPFKEKTIYLTPAEWIRLQAKLPALKKSGCVSIVIDGKPYASFGPGE